MMGLMRYRLAIFDFDGTLADSFSWFLGVVNRLADDSGSAAWRSMRSRRFAAGRPART